jgi:hypothetical protein
VLRRARGSNTLAAFTGHFGVYQMVTLSSGSSQRASDAVTSNVA